MSKQKKGGSRVLDAVLSLALIAGVGYGCFYVVSNGVKIDQTTTYYTAEPTEPAEPEPDPNALTFESTEIANSEVTTGPLVLVNNTYPCATGEDWLVSLYQRKIDILESQQLEDPHSFSVRDADLLVQEDFADAIIEMLDDFHAATGDDNVIVISGYRSQELQQQLYDQDLAQTGAETSERVAKPGYSEHQTGLGIDLDLYGDAEFDGTGVYAWIDEHCADYGIILRYPENKTAVTEITFEPWHYRYVGKPHAAYMMQNDMCLEEYITLLETTYPYEGEHLRITDTDGKVYEVYYYAKDEGYESTMVAVPAGLPYTVSGSNTGGFIVTVDTGETADPAAAQPEDGTPEDGGDAPADNPEPDNAEDDPA